MPHALRSLELELERLAIDEDSGCSVAAVDAHDAQPHSARVTESEVNAFAEALRRIRTRILLPASGIGRETPGRTFGGRAGFH